MALGRSRRQACLGAILGALGGAGLVLACPPFGLWPLIFVGFVPIAVAEQRVLPRRYAGVALVLGVGTYVSAQAWGALEPGQRWFLIGLIPLLLAGGRLDGSIQRATEYRHLWWSSPVLWTAALFALGFSPIASWIDPAFALYRQPWLIQPVSIVGVSGLDLLILTVNYLLATAIIVRPARVLVSGIAVVILALWIGASVALLDVGRAGQSIRVAAIQPGPVAVVHGTQPAGTPSSQRAVLEQLISGTRTAAVEGAQLVVWPEKALAFDPRVSMSTLRRLASSTGTYLVIGYTPDPARFNRAVILTPTGDLTGVYDKQHPVTIEGDHSVGGPVVVTKTSLGAIAPIICYDLDYENTARSAADKGAQLLAVPSEDWPGIAYQHYAHLVFRAVENRLAAVKADTAWDSAIIDPEGRIVRSQVSERASGAVLVATAPLGSGSSPFVATGNWLGWATVAMSLAWLLIAARSRLRIYRTPDDS